MRSLLPLGLVLAAAPALAQTPPPAEAPPPAEEEDDPAFSRQPPLPPPPEEEDPGFVEAPPPDADDGHGVAPAAPPPRDTISRPRRPLEARGMKLRVAYRTFTLDEFSMPGVGKTDRFHVVSLDAYPISSSVRLGLVSQFGFESSQDDWFGTVGLGLGVQRIGRATPYGEVKAHTGLTRRTFCLATPSQTGCQDHLTLLWGFGLEAGVDVILSGRMRGTVALGVERNQYFAAEIKDEMGDLAVITDVTFTVKLGIGY